MLSTLSPLFIEYFLGQTWNGKAAISGPDPEDLTQSALTVAGLGHPASFRDQQEMCISHG